MIVYQISAKRNGISSVILRNLVEKSDSWTITQSESGRKSKALYDSLSSLLQHPELSYGE